eukprot:c15185_g1_i1 orf=381-1931(-)
MASVGTISLPTQCFVGAHTSSEPLCKHGHTSRHGQSSFAGLSSCKRPGFDANHQLAVAGRPGNYRIEILDFSGITENEAENAYEQSQNELSLSAHAMAPVMKRGYGAFGGGATLEKSKLDLTQKTSQVAPKTEDGGGGGDIGKGINHGGGDGGDDGGDDDDYFGDADDDDEGDDGGFFGRRIALPEVFDRKIVEAIMQEWYKTFTDLPAGLRQAVELGFISSAQMVRYLSHIGRPTVARHISRAIPPSASRAFVGRMIADPSFLYKMCWEQFVTVAYGSWWEFKHRRERLKDEWGLAAVNILSLCLCNAAIVWSLAPCRSYGSTFKFNLQNTIQKLPNNVFERSYAFREFDVTKRVQSFFYKAGELCLVGLLTGAASGGLVKLIGSRKENLTVPAPTVKTSALSYGAFLGLSGNLRYQLLYGAERVMQQQFNHVGVVVFCSTLLRALNIYVGDASRVSWLGLDVAAEQNPESSQQAYRRPSLPSLSQLEGMLKFDNMLPKAPTTRRKVKRRVLVAS